MNRNQLQNSCTGTFTHCSIYLWWWGIYKPNTSCPYLCSVLMSLHQT